MIKSVRLTNFFSFRDCEVSLEPDVTVLVGINGSGKTNLLRAFELLKAGMEGELGKKLAEWGGMETIRSAGRGVPSAENIEVKYTFTQVFNEYDAWHALRYRLMWSKDSSDGGYHLSEHLNTDEQDLLLAFRGGIGWTNSEGIAQTEIAALNTDRTFKNTQQWREKSNELALANNAVSRALPPAALLAKQLELVMLHADFDSCPKSPMRTAIQATGLDVLDADGANLFQILNTIQLKSTEAGDAIERDLRSVNPNFDRLQFQPLGQGGMLTYLREVGLKTPIPAAHVSDGTLRFLCLLAIAHNPDRGRLICLDEPERGLHPDMLAAVARLLLQDGHAAPEAPRHTGYVVATHSPQLLSHFPLRCLRVFEKDENNQTVVRQFSDDDGARFREWYEAFDPGSLWLKGELGGTRW